MTGTNLAKMTNSEVTKTSGLTVQYTRLIAFASHSVYFMFMKNGHIMFILELSNQNEKGILDLFSHIFCQTPTTFTQMDLSCAQDGFVPNYSKTAKCLLQRKLFSFGTKPSCAKS